ncbi:MAG: hypothetical protein OXI18_04965 [bacterium]|nr:hypothetical protein [bacterium]
MAEELLTSIRIGLLHTAASARPDWRDDIFRGFRPTKISRSVALTRVGWFANSPGYLQQLADIYLEDLSIPGAFGERLAAAADDARVPGALRQVFADLAVTDGLASVPSGVGSDETESPAPAPALQDTDLPATPPTAAAKLAGQSAQTSTGLQRSYGKEPFTWTPPRDDTSVVQDAVTLFERSLSAFVADRLQAIHGDGWLRRGCGQYRSRWAEKAADATASPPTSELGYAELAELGEIIGLKANWPVFAPYFGTKKAVEQEFAHILPLRVEGSHAGQRVLYAPEKAAAFAAMARMAGYYHQPTADAIADFWTPGEPEPSPTRRDTDITANLILKNFAALPSQPLLGRDHELREVHEFWQDPFARSISVSGRGGLGKTALVYEFVNDLLRVPVHPDNKPDLELALFLTAKQTWADQDDQVRLPESQRFGTLREAFHATLDLFDEGVEGSADLGTLRRHVLELAQGSTCLFVFDNLETLPDEEIAGVADFCRDLPPPSKAIVTDRVRRGFGIGRPMTLPPLSTEASLNLIDRRLATDSVPLPAEGRATLTRVVAELGGVPLHLHYVANLLGRGHSPQEALQHLRGEDTLGLLKFSFESSLKGLPTSALEILLYLAEKKEPATRKQLRRLSESDITFNEDLDSLKGAHFVELAPGTEAIKFQIADRSLRDYIILETPGLLGEEVTARLRHKAGARSDLSRFPNIQRAIEQALREAESRSWEDGIRYLESRRSEFKNAPEILAKLGYLYFRCYDRKNARKFLEQSIAAGWEDAMALRTLGIINLRDGRLEEAAENSEASLTLNPDDKLTQRLLGEVLLTQAEQSLFTLGRERRLALAKRAHGLIDDSLIEDDYARWQQSHNEERLRLLERCERLLQEDSDSQAQLGK